MTMKGKTLSKPDSPLLTVLDVCHIFGICQRTAWRWVTEGKLPAPLRLSKAKARWRRTDIEKWIETGAST